MAGVVYSGVTINGDKINSMISYDTDFVYTSKSKKSSLFARVEFVNDGTQVAIVSYDEKDGEESIYQPLRSRVLPNIKVEDFLHSTYWFIEDMVIEKMGEEAFQQEVEQLLSDTNKDIENGIVIHNGVCKKANYL